jgi:hypothetical protein
MFKKSLKKEEAETDSGKNYSDNSLNDYLLVFQVLVSSSLDRIGVDNDCNLVKNEKWNQENEDNHIKLLNELRYDDLFDKGLLNELERRSGTD